MRASVGDKLVIQGHHVGEHERDAKILEVRGKDGAPPYLVRWSDTGHEALVFPGPDASIAHPGAGRRREAATPGKVDGATQQRLDLRKELGEIYRPRPGASIVLVPPISFLMIDGVGDPQPEGEYRDALQALYSLAYTLKFAGKGADPPRDFAMMPLASL